MANLKDCDITEVPVSGGGAKELMSGAVDAATLKLLHELGIVKSDIDPTGKFVEVE